MPTTHTTTVSQERAVLLYVMVQGLPIDVGAITEKEIRECAMKNHKTVALLFPSLINSICLVFRVSTTAQDECIKKEGGLTAHTIERITGESTTALSELAVVAGARRFIGVEKRLQELSDIITQFAKVQ